MMYGWNGPMGPLGLVYLGIAMVLFWGGLIATVVVIGRTVLTWQARRHPRLPDALAQQLLAERFARGDIDEDTFRRQRELLQRP